MGLSSVMKRLPLPLGWVNLVRCVFKPSFFINLIFVFKNTNLVTPPALRFI